MSIGLTADRTSTVVQPHPTEEYIGGGSWFPLYGGYGSLADHILQATNLGGPALADLMMTDEAVAGSVLTIAEGILAQGHQLTAKVELDDQEEIDDLTADDLKAAFAIEDHCRRCWNGLGDPQGLLWRLIQGSMRYRTMLAEVVKEVASGGPDDGKYVFARIPVKEPGSWSFHLDTYGNVRGIHAHLVSPTGAASISNLLSPEKFIVLAWDPIKGHPWGEGILQRAYNAWNFKIQLYPMLWKYAQLFAIPQTEGQPGESARKRRLVDDKGIEYGEEVPAEVWLFKSLEKMKKGGSLVVTPFGTTMKIHSPPGNGAVFSLIFDMLDRAIVKGIQQVTRSAAGMKRSNGTDAAAEQDLLGMPVSYGKAALAECLERDLWRIHVRQNFGEEMAHRFTPDVSFGMTRGQDFSRNAHAVSKLYSVGLLGDPEKRDTLKFLGLNFGRRRKSDPAADLSTQPTKGSRPVKVSGGAA